MTEQESRDQLPMETMYRVSGDLYYNSSFASSVTWKNEFGQVLPVWVYDCSSYDSVKTNAMLLENLAQKGYDLETKTFS